MSDKSVSSSASVFLPLAAERPRLPFALAADFEADFAEDFSAFFFAAGVFSAVLPSDFSAAFSADLAADLVFDGLDLLAGAVSAVSSAVLAARVFLTLISAWAAFVADAACVSSGWAFLEVVFDALTAWFFFLTSVSASVLGAAVLPELAFLAVFFTAASSAAGADVFLAGMDEPVKGMAMSGAECIQSAWLTRSNNGKEGMSYDAAGKKCFAARGQDVRAIIWYAILAGKVAAAFDGARGVPGPEVLLSLLPRVKAQNYSGAVCFQELFARKCAIANGDAAAVFSSRPRSRAL